MRGVANPNFPQILIRLGMHAIVWSNYKPKPTM